MKFRSMMLAVAALAAGALALTATPAVANADLAGGIKTYHITVKTGDLPNAGTDGTVRLTVFGDAGQSPGTKLDNGNDNFERNRTDVFRYKWQDIGKPGWISLGKAGNGSEWYPEYVQIYDEAAGALYTCIVQEWYPDSSLTRFYGCA